MDIIKVMLRTFTIFVAILITDCKSSEVYFKKMQDQGKHIFLYYISLKIQIWMQLRTTQHWSKDIVFLIILRNLNAKKIREWLFKRLALNQYKKVFDSLSKNIETYEIIKIC